MKAGSRAALAVGIGYVLGRRHKLRTAAILGGVVASGRLGTLGSAAVKRGASLAGANDVLGKMSPQLGGIANTVKGELRDAGKAAVMTVVNNRIESLSDSLHQRTESIRQGGAAGPQPGRSAT
jgi:hypothetical protein